MNIDDVFPSEHLKAADLKGRDVTVTIQGIERKEFDDGAKLILSFAESPRTLVLNKTNAHTIADLYGPETDSWLAKQITLWPTQTDYGGRQVACIRIRLAAPKGTAGPVTVPDVPVEDESDIPF